MTSRRPRITVGRMMLVIAALAVFLGLLRANLYAGIFAACVASGTFARARGAIVRRLRSGRGVSGGQKARVVVSSLVITTMILGLCDLVFLFVAMRVNQPAHGLVTPGAMAILVGAVCSLALAIFLRLVLWPCEIDDGPWWRSVGEADPGDLLLLDVDAIVAAAVIPPADPIEATSVDDGAALES